jgi:hypothetical protein
VIEPTSSLQIHPKTLDTRAPPLRHSYSPKHSVFHLSSAFHHTYPCEFFPSQYHISFEILFYSIVLVMSSVVYFDTIAHDFFYFQRNCQFFRNNSLVKAINYSIVFEMTFYKSELEQTD